MSHTCSETTILHRKFLDIDATSAQIHSRGNVLAHQAGPQKRPNRFSLFYLLDAVGRAPITEISADTFCQGTRKLRKENEVTKRMLRPQPNANSCSLSSECGQLVLLHHLFQMFLFVQESSRMFKKNTPVPPQTSTFSLQGPQSSQWDRSTQSQLSTFYSEQKWQWLLVFLAVASPLPPITGSIGCFSGPVGSYQGGSL